MIERRVLMRQIVNRNSQAHARRHAAHRADRAIFQSEVRLQHERVFGRVRADHQRIATIPTHAPSRKQAAYRSA